MQFILNLLEHFLLFFDWKIEVWNLLKISQGSENYTKKEFEMHKFLIFAKFVAPRSN